MPKKQNVLKPFTAPATGGGVRPRNASGETIEQARIRAAGAPGPAHNPQLQAYAAAELVDRAHRTVIGRYEIKGRSPSITLSPGQFSTFKETGSWPGMPTVEEYGPQHATPEDKEYTKDF